MLDVSVLVAVDNAVWGGNRFVTSDSWRSLSCRSSSLSHSFAIATPMSLATERQAGSFNWILLGEKKKALNESGPLGL